MFPYLCIERYEEGCVDTHSRAATQAQGSDTVGMIGAGKGAQERGAGAGNGGCRCPPSDLSRWFHHFFFLF